MHEYEIGLTKRFIFNRFLFYQNIDCEIDDILTDVWFGRYLDSSRLYTESLISRK